MTDSQYSEIYPKIKTLVEQIKLSFDDLPGFLFIEVARIYFAEIIKWARTVNPAASKEAVNNVLCIFKEELCTAVEQAFREDCIVRKATALGLLDSNTRNEKDISICPKCSAQMHVDELCCWRCDACGTKVIEGKSR